MFRIDQIGVDNKRIEKEQCQKCLYDLIVQLLKSGPTIVHMEIINFLFKSKIDMKVYLQSLSGPKLKFLIEALEQYKYTGDEKTPLKDYCVCFKKCIPHVIDCFMDHLKIIKDVLGKSGYPRNSREVLHMSRALQSLLECSVKDDHVTDLWEELLQVSRCACLCRGSSQMSTVLDTYQTFYSDLPMKIFSNKKIFTKWAAVHINILNEVKNSELLACFIPSGVTTMLENHISSSGDEVQWIAILQGLLRHPHGNLTEAAYDAKVIINIVKCIEIPTDMDPMDRRSICYHYGEIISYLLKLLKSSNLSHLVMGEVVELIIGVFEMRSEDACQIIAEIGHLELQSCKDCVLALLKRFEPMFKDTSYPWTNHVVSNSGLTLIQSVNDAYSSGSEIPNDVNQYMISILGYCMEDQVRRFDEDKECPTIFGLVYLTVLPSYCLKVAKTLSSALSELVPKILKMMNDPDENISEVAKGIVMQIGTLGAPQILAPHLKFLLKMCLSTPSKSESVLHSLSFIYTHNTEPMCDSFQEIFQKFCVDINSESYGRIVMPLLTKVAELQPQKNSDVLCDHLTKLLSIKDQSFIQKGAYYINMILVNVASEHQRCVKPVFEYFMKKLNANLKDQNNTLLMIDCLQQLSDKYPTREITLYRECLTELAKSGTTPTVRITASNLLIDLDKRMA
ncbi:hypothetical protein KUTeg_017801 [Tegillarca granosa]|uniref:Uncharacterized protein n=1 Tax=Tegillarca granosa TaxID=220873 RepID=A0ABQ9EG04_TEGGR|nr:hypothetical protein KUTeg_017801 [Tegillarca granosa]